MRLRHTLSVSQCAGMDHMDFTADGRRALVSCDSPAGWSWSIWIRSIGLSPAQCRRTSSSHPTGAPATSRTWRPLLDRTHGDPALMRHQPWTGGRARALALALVAALVAAACGGEAGDANPGPTVPSVAADAAPARSHVVVVVMENKEQFRVLGSSDAPYLTGLARRSGTATQSYGVTHPS